MFIKAEAQYWAGNIADAYNTTVEATKENMARYGIVEAFLEDTDPTKYNGGAPLQALWQSLCPERKLAALPSLVPHRV